MAPSSVPSNHNRSPPASSVHFSQIPDATRPSSHAHAWHGSSLSFHSSGRKRKHASQKNAAELYGSARLKATELDLEHGIRKRLQANKVEVDCDLMATTSGTVGLLALEDSDIKHDIAFGRFGVWHPQSSVVKDENGSLFTAAPMEDLEVIYKLPTRRLRERRDGPGGALFFQETELMTLGLQEALSKHCVHPHKATRFGLGIDAVQWNVVTKGDRSYSTPRDCGEKTGFDKASSEDDTFLKNTGSLNFSDMRTGDDAIRYFAELETGGPVKFVYCNRVDSGKEFSPYDLVVVPREEVNPEYFIISAAAMVHIEPGKGLFKENPRMIAQSLAKYVVFQIARSSCHHWFLYCRLSQSILLKSVQFCDFMSSTQHPLG